MVAVILYNAQPVYPQILVAEISAESNSIQDDLWDRVFA
jgi:hypothetical protein